MHDAHRTAYRGDRWPGRKALAKFWREFGFDRRIGRNEQKAHAVTASKIVNFGNHGTVTKAIATSAGITFIGRLRTGCAIRGRLATGTSGNIGTRRLVGVERADATHGARQHRSD